MTRSPDAVWLPGQESLRATLLRNGAIALIGGAIFARWLGGISHWPIATSLLLWPSSGGHWVEPWFIRYLRPRGRSSFYTALR